MTTHDMLPLDRVYFIGPTPIHGRLVREIVRGQLMASPEGGTLPGWDVHLHAEWQCVVVEGGAEVDEAWALVPLQHVRSMTVHGEKLTPHVGAVLPEAQRRGRPRTKRLDFVRD